MKKDVCFVQEARGPYDPGERELEALAHLSLENAPRSVVELAQFGVFFHRRLADLLARAGIPLWGTEMEKSAFITADGAERANALLKALKVLDSSWSRDSMDAETLGRMTQNSRSAAPAVVEVADGAMPIPTTIATVELLLNAPTSLIRKMAAERGRGGMYAWPQDKMEEYARLSMAARIAREACVHALRQARRPKASARCDSFANDVETLLINYFVYAGISFNKRGASEHRFVLSTAPLKRSSLFLLVQGAHIDAANVVQIAHDALVGRCCKSCGDKLRAVRTDLRRRGGAGSSD